MADFALSEVEVFAVSICKGPANRKRILLRKQEVPNEQVFEVSRSPIFKVGGFDNDWSVFYTVVAEPGWEEQPGIGRGATPGTTDVWENEQEILKAAHSFMRSGALINLQHRDDVRVGQVVENFVAPTDMVLDTPEGPQTIKKGSWVIGIEPEPELKQAIDSGELDGVSYEGTGFRTPIAKAVKDPGKNKAYRTCRSCGARMKIDQSKCPNCGATWVAKKGGPKRPLTNKPGVSNWIEQEGGLPPYIRRVAEHIFAGTPGDDPGNAIQKAIGVVRDWAKGLRGASPKTQAKAAAAIAEFDRKRASAKSH